LESVVGHPKAEKNSGLELEPRYLSFATLVVVKNWITMELGSIFLKKNMLYIEVPRLNCSILMYSF
jgi:hypothetical protein